MKEGNVFLVSDASFCDKTKIAGLAVIDMHTGEKHLASEVMSRSRSCDAELQALLFSADIAMNNNYNNVVFIYDYMHIDTSRVDEHIRGRIENYQFLWLKRMYVAKADKIARKARKSCEEISSHYREESSKKNSKTVLKEKLLLNAFKRKSAEAIIKACSAIANEIEKKRLQRYLADPRKVSEVLLGRGEKLNYRFYNLVYYLLPKNEQPRFVEYIMDFTEGKADKIKLTGTKKQIFYINQVEHILGVLKRKSLNKSKV
jgi:hypothetical protein